MALIKTDPSQTKTVIALLIVLVGAVGITAFRLTGSAAPPAPAKESEDVVQIDSPVSEVGEATYGASKNPFIKPANYVADADPSKVAIRIDEAGMSIRQAGGSWDTPESQNLLPMPVGTQEDVNPAPAVNEGTSPNSVNEETKQDLRVVLMATVGNLNGQSAVIKINDSITRVVQIGDRLESGHKVVNIYSNRIVLADGRNTIVAKRPI